MGKTKCDEIIKRKFNKYEDTLVNDELLDDIYFENNQESQKEDNEIYINETAILIRQKIFEYVNDGVHPLCEYLSVDNVENYVKWLLS
jgi:hypothetical protein